MAAYEYETHTYDVVVVGAGGAKACATGAHNQQPCMPSGLNHQPYACQQQSGDHSDMQSADGKQMHRSRPTKRLDYVII